MVELTTSFRSLCGVIRSTKHPTCGDLDMLDSLTQHVYPNIEVIGKDEKASSRFNYSIVLQVL